ncbi:MAG: ATP-binding protein [Polyangiaceae bacterium]|jgi:PAS domain S-box-containing protein|nr:ATP-binding protein [Polyangiaceae bacterium]
MAARILIVDDNTALAENLRDVLEGASGFGARVSTVASSQEAERVARERGFDVALVDVKLPDGNGVQLVRALRAAAPLSEVVLITGFATVDSAIAALQAGAFAFLLKSYRPEELISTVEQAFAKVQLKHERQELERRQRALIETAGVLIVAVDRTGRVALFNPKVAELTAAGLPVAVGRSLLVNWVAEVDRERVARALDEARQGSAAVEIEAGFVDGAGAAPTRRVRWHLSAVRSDEGPGDLVYGIGIDVTERRALEKRAAEAEALSAMGELALGLAHEIRNPLNAAVLQLHLLARAIERLEHEGKASMRQRVSIVETEIKRLERLLTEFLELARPRGIELDQVDLGALVEAVVDLEAEALAERRVTLSRETESGAFAAGDAEKLKQVLLNLIANGRDALREGGAIKVHVRAGDSPGFDVSDDGPGIDPKVLESVFDPFFTTKEAGTGLGLAIVRKIVDQHRGTIRIDSSPGVGTRVEVRLPPWRGERRSNAPRALRLGQPPG